MSEPSNFGRDRFNRHKWRRDTTWWDDLEVDFAAVKDRFYGNVFDWLESVAPDPYEHDYILYTDGSGCAVGWGGYAAVIERIELVDEDRRPVSSQVLVSGTYGSTVQRCEFSALLDGVHAILSSRCGEMIEEALGDDAAAYDLKTAGALSKLMGPERLTILWYTDRNNLAQCFLHDSDGNPLLARNRERDLWMRWAFMSKHVCITPMHRPRTVVDGQAICDEMAGVARALMKGAADTLSVAAEKIHSIEQWKKSKPQSAIF